MERAKKEEFISKVWDGEDMWTQGLFISMYDKIHYKNTHTHPHKKKKKFVIFFKHCKIKIEKSSLYTIRKLPPD